MAAPDVLRTQGFAPVCDARTRLLILGSLPGGASLKAGQYYAHPRNGFWRLIGEVIGQDLMGLDYPDRLGALKTVGVGLWDVIATALRPGSLDASIRELQAADLPRLIAGLPELKAVAFNGGLAARLGRRQLATLSDAVALIDLPSSSPAHARPLSEKARRWAVLRPVLFPGTRLGDPRNEPS